MKMLTIEEMQQLAIERGGKCLSTEYINANEHLLWRCLYGHQWNATPECIKQGSWCPTCAGKNVTIEEMRQMAIEHGGKCLSIEYINAKTKLEWQCEHGHRWKAVHSSIKAGAWCPTCGKIKRADKLRGTIEEMQLLAIERSGKCLSKEYINSTVKLEWQCVHGHKWKAKPAHIKAGSWCPKCSFKEGADRRRGAIEEAQQLAIERCGKCLSTEYVNANTRLLWECEQGHQWTAIFSSIKRGSWCPTCNGNPIVTIEDMQQLALERGGKCLSTKYVDSKTKLVFQCEYGHQWNTTPSGIKTGKWCPRCAAKIKADKQRGTIEEMQQLAIEHGGKCLSIEYIDCKTPLLWECADGHQWEARPDNIKSSFWCPECNTWMRERKTRFVFEYILGVKFVSTRKVIAPLELDGYNADLQLAFEYQGKQHYSFVPIFHESKEAFEEQNERDNLKRRMCKENNIDLIEIPYFKAKADEDLSSYIIEELRNIGHIVNTRFEDIPWGDFYKNNSQLTDLNEVAEQRGGKCLSTRYEDSSTPLLWQCANGHRWKTSPANIKTGTWCPKCALKLKIDKLRGTIEEMKELAIERGGKCLSTKYVDSSIKLEWQCKHGHQWNATPGNIKAGKWCPKCAHQKLAAKKRGTIEEAQQLAVEHGGKCLSTEYVNNRAPLLWQCAERHQWEAGFDNIKRGTWCPKCAIEYRASKRRSSIEEMQQIAKGRNGKCLSKKYFNSSTPLLWECSEGHRFERVAPYVKKGGWCPICLKSGINKD